MAKHKRAIHAAVEASTTPPDALAPSQALARVVRAEGNRLFALVLPDKTSLSAEMPDRFRNTLWVRRGGYVLIELREEVGGEDDKKDEGRKVAAEIVNVVREEKEWRKQPYWPKEFVKNTYGLDDEDEDSNVGKMPPSDDSESDQVDA